MKIDALAQMSERRVFTGKRGRIQSSILPHPIVSSSKYDSAYRSGWVQSRNGFEKGWFTEMGHRLYPGETRATFLELRQRRNKHARSKRRKLFVERIMADWSVPVSSPTR